MGAVKNMKEDVMDLIWTEYEKMEEGKKDFAVAANSAVKFAEDLYGSAGKNLIDACVDDYYGGW